ncbi:uncharacterized protein LOC111266391 isoform X2 [Varroa jacobsoni]|uniref:uncharacterized protein LOC111266391 isoform X2 n=1 Tax=Varroa jacobsoni TaxID=62625 RepID=UPI000BF347A7|nr:uncharacterized protein LOC111266391 isoform X2 [Varroa jacobsoni]
MTTEESLEQLLDLGLPPKLNQVSECPLDEDDFVAFRSQGDQCLHIAEKLQIGERYILISVCQRFPLPEAHLPPVLNICDSHLPQNKLVGARCLVHLSKEFTHDNNRGGRADVVVDALLRLTYAHDDLKIVALAYEGLELLLLKSGSCHLRRSEIYLHLLRQCAMAFAIEEKILLGQILIRFVDGMGQAAGEFAQTTLEVAEFWADASATRISAMCLLQSALSCGAVSTSWERVARILLNSAIRCTQKNHEEVQAIFLCRQILNKVRTYPESPEEVAVFDLLR